MELDIASEQVSAGIAVHVRVRLSPRELNRLFLAGDTLIQLPLDGLVDGAEAAPIPRSSIFLSEIAGSPDGFSRTFADAAHADAFATAVRGQISDALEAS
ncbi:MAG TPA: hypothetical protein VK576_06315 [Thermoleophilia bacterium]|nr:hypothetical protein [Thermoleophilia bacterium]